MPYAVTLINMEFNLRLDQSYAFWMLLFFDTKVTVSDHQKATHSAHSWYNRKNISLPCKCGIQGVTDPQFLNIFSQLKRLISMHL